MSRETEYVIKRDKPTFTVCYNSVVQHLDNAEALGLWVYLSSHSENWTFYKSQLMAHFKFGRNKLDRLFRYLKEQNLIKIEQKRAIDGRFSQIEIIVSDGLNWEKVTTVAPKSADGLPMHGKQHLINTNEIKTKVNNIYIGENFFSALETACINFSANIKNNASLFHKAVSEWLLSNGFVIKNEHPVKNYLPDRNGRIDILAQNNDGQFFAIELDNRSPRTKSIDKLKSIDAIRIIILRNADKIYDYDGINKIICIFNKNSTRKTFIDESYQPNSNHFSLANELKISVEEELPKFIAHHISKANEMANWDMAFNLWLRKAKQFSASRNFSQHRDNFTQTILQGLKNDYRTDDTEADPCALLPFSGDLRG